MNTLLSRPFHHEARRTNNPEDNREGLTASVLVVPVGDDSTPRCPVTSVPPADIEFTTGEPVFGCDVMLMSGPTDLAAAIAAGSATTRFRGETIPADTVKIRVPACERDRVVFTTTDGEIELDDMRFVPAGSEQGVNDYLLPRRYHYVRVVAVPVPSLTGTGDVDPFDVNVSPPYVRPAP